MNELNGQELAALGSDPGLCQVAAAPNSVKRYN
jgi:hypothetical protein